MNGKSIHLQTLSYFFKKIVRISKPIRSKSSPKKPC
jgi:hypothetical protein